MGTWRGPRTQPNPLRANDRAWRQIAAYWRRLRLPCAQCGSEIRYDEDYWLTIQGRRTINPRALNVGHIISLAEAARRGWTAKQANDITNTRPEHARCNLNAGAKLGQRVQTQRTKVTTLRW